MSSRASVADVFAPVAPVTRRRIESVQSLRGLASVAVAFHHFFTATAMQSPAILKAIASHGDTGVNVFFVISGFILPYSLWRGKYRLSLHNFGTFVWKRIVRLDPPYLVAILLTIALNYFSRFAPWFHGAPNQHYSFIQLALHLGYLNAFTHWPFISPVFWTLAIECQFYLLIALAFPLFVDRRPVIRLLSAGLLLLGSTLLPANYSLLHVYLPFFICGIAAFQYYGGISGKWEILVVLLVVTAQLLWRFGTIKTAAALLTAAIIVGAPLWTNKTLVWLGTLSYSLYLVHFPIGTRAVNLVARLPPSWMTMVLAIVAGFAMSLGAAYLLYQFVERRSKEYADSLRFTIMPPND